MGTVAEKLTYLNDTKTAIKDAIVAKGVSVADTDTFRSYATKIGEISGGGGAPATKYGVSIDNILGDADENGVLQAPTKSTTLDLTGVTRVGIDALSFAFYKKSNLLGVKANDLIEIIGASAFDSAFYDAVNCSFFYFDSVEEVSKNYAFNRCFYTAQAPVKRIISFKKLKKISGNYAFNEAFHSSYRENYPVMDEIFPSLDEISGFNVFYNFVTQSSSYPNTFSSVKKIIGGSATYSSTFGSYYSKNITWNFPRAVDFSGYIWNVSSSYPGEIHFAVANQAAIEACDGYANKWGYAGATIYFDLILSITVGGVVYDRDGPKSIHINGKTPYVAWADESGNIVYTDATAEPTVGTAVYSDAGTTQVGTVEGVA